MTAGPGDEPAVPAGRGHLRATHDDREHVVERLKAAFVHGRLTKEELEARAGQALAARTYADLAVLTADLPGEPIAAPHPAAPARTRRLPVGTMALVGTGVLTPPAILAAAILTGNDELGKVFLMIFPWYVMGWLIAALQILDNQRKRSRGQLPPRPAQPGWALEGDQCGGTGDDRTLAEARGNRRSPPARPARCVPANPQVTA